jgi:hypothetical protein
METMVDAVVAQPYRWPHDGQFGPENTALVIIDMQMDFVSDLLHRWREDRVLCGQPVTVESMF